MLLVHPKLYIPAAANFWLSCLVRAACRYAETVIHRIFYALNRSGNGRLSLRELKRGDLLATLHALDDEEDINKITRFWSYEHFYVSDGGGRKLL